MDASVQHSEDGHTAYPPVKRGQKAYGDAPVLLFTGGLPNQDPITRPIVNIRQMIHETMAQYPDLGARIGVADTLSRISLDGALQDQSPELQAIFEEDFSHAILKEAAADRELSEGRPFTMQATVAGTEYALVSPVSLYVPLLGNGYLGAGRLPWHRDIGRESADNAPLHDQLVFLHEMGHALIRVREMKPAMIEMSRDRETGKHDVALAGHLEENFCDTFGALETIRRQPDQAQALVQDMQDMRALSIVTRYALGVNDRMHASSLSWIALSEAIADPDKLAEMTRDPYEAALRQTAALPMTSDALKALNMEFKGLRQGDTEQPVKAPRFIARVAAIAADTTHPSSFALARDYLDALDRRLEPDSTLRAAVSAGLKMAEGNPLGERFPPSPRPGASPEISADNDEPLRPGGLALWRRFRRLAGKIGAPDPAATGPRPTGPASGPGAGP